MTTLAPVKFGTSGHRGIIKSSFTHEHVVAISHAIADYVLNLSDHPVIVIGYDPRQGNSLSESPSFTQDVVNTLSSRGIHCYISANPVPTPVISWVIQQESLQGGIILTASHNPPEYNGIKFNPSNGAPASTHATQIIEEKANYYLSNPYKSRSGESLITSRHLDESFARHVIKKCHSLIPDLPANDHRHIPISIDAKHGTSGKIWSQIMTLLQWQQIPCLHQDPKSDFNGLDPNPLSESGLNDLKDSIQTHQSVMGISNDPDADRFVVLDENGTVLSPEMVAAIIVKFLSTTDQPITKIATTVASSHLLKKLASVENLEFVETPVGFKHFTPHFEQSVKDGSLCLGVESSGGLSLSSHVFEKCGFLPPLLILGISLATRTPISKLVTNIYDIVGELHFLETAITLSPQQHDKLSSLLNNPQEITSCFNQPISTLLSIDGLKVEFSSDEWCLIRLSGTEPVCRVYAESPSLNNSQTIIDQFEAWLSN